MLGVALDELFEGHVTRWVFAPATPAEVVALIEGGKGLREIFTKGTVRTEFLGEIREAHEICGASWGITEARAPAEGVDGVLEPLRELVQSMGDTLIQLVATIDRSKPETIATFKAAVLPLDGAKVAAARRAAAKVWKDDAPEEDAPEGADTAPGPKYPYSPPKHQQRPAQASPVRALFLCRREQGDSSFRSKESNCRLSRPSIPIFVEDRRPMLVSEALCVVETWANWGVARPG